LRLVNKPQNAVEFDLFETCHHFLAQFSLGLPWHE